MTGQSRIGRAILTVVAVLVIVALIWAQVRWQ